jgi:hypothetical protein
VRHTADIGIRRCFPNAPWPVILPLLAGFLLLEGDARGYFDLAKDPKPLRGLIRARHRV